MSNYTVNKKLIGFMQKHKLSPLNLNLELFRNNDPLIKITDTNTLAVSIINHDYKFNAICVGGPINADELINVNFVDECKHIPVYSLKTTDVKLQESYIRDYLIKINDWLSYFYDTIQYNINNVVDDTGDEITQDILDNLFDDSSDEPTMLFKDKNNIELINLIALLTTDSKILLDTFPIIKELKRMLIIEDAPEIYEYLPKDKYFVGTLVRRIIDTNIEHLDKSIDFVSEPRKYHDLLMVAITTNDNKSADRIPKWCSNDEYEHAKMLAISNDTYNDTLLEVLNKFPDRVYIQDISEEKIDTIGSEFDKLYEEEIAETKVEQPNEVDSTGGAVEDSKFEEFEKLSAKLERKKLVENGYVIPGRCNCVLCIEGRKFGYDV